jgi:hypothetical protein
VFGEGGEGGRTKTGIMNTQYVLLQAPAASALRQHRHYHQQIAKLAQIHGASF